jgi:hypothetical protein
MDDRKGLRLFSVEMQCFAVTGLIKQFYLRGVKKNTFLQPPSLKGQN